MNKMQKIVESRVQAFQQRRAVLLKNWSPYLDAVGQYMKESQNKKLSPMDQFNIAQCLDNALDQASVNKNSRLIEATYSDNIEFLGIQLPVIAALIPSLVLNEVAIVQALDRRQGAVFYLDVKYDTAKGDVAAGDVMMSARTGHASSVSARRYAMSRVDDESCTGDTLATATLSGSLAYDSIQLGTVEFVSGDEIIKDDTNAPGKLVNSSGTPCGWVTEAGTYQVTFAAAPDSAGVVTVSYQYHYDQATDGVPQASIDLSCETLTAEDFPLRAHYSVAAGLDLQKAHGLSLEDELVKYLGGEIKFEIDHYGLDMIVDAASSADGANGTTGNGTWVATPTSGQEWLWKKNEFLDKIEKGSNLIFGASLRGFCNFLLVGNNVARVIRQLPNFKPASGLDKAVPTGPLKLGTLDNRVIIQDPFQATNRYILGYRGDNYLYAGFIYAPYIPLFTTPTLITSDLMAQKGFLSSSGFKVINSKLFTFGDVDVSGL